MRIAMVCLGNICRSPMAESVARSLVDDAGLSDAVEVVSFGTAGYHDGERADPGATAALGRHAWPNEGHRARQLRAADLDDLDLIACADHANLRAVLHLGAGGDAEGPEVVMLRSFDPSSTTGDDEVPDPYGGGPKAFDASLALIERACRGLVADLVAKRRYA